MSTALPDPATAPELFEGVLLRRVHGLPDRRALIIAAISTVACCSSGWSSAS